MNRPAGAQRAALARDHQCHRRRVVVGATHDLDELGEHRVRHGVALLGPIDGDHTDLPVHVVANERAGVVGHGATVLNPLGAARPRGSARRF